MRKRRSEAHRCQNLETLTWQVGHKNDWNWVPCFSDKLKFETLFFPNCRHLNVLGFAVSEE